MKRPLIVGILVAALGVAGALAWNAVTRDRQYQRLIAAGDTALAAGQTLLAIEWFSGAIALRPASMLGYLKRGETYHRHGDVTAAVRDLRKASVLDRTATRPLEQLGDVYVAQGYFGRAAERYQAYLRLDDRSPRLLYKLALARYAQGNPADAIPPLRQAVHLNDRFAEGYYLLGVCLASQQQRAEALWSLQRAIRLVPGLTPAREALAGLYNATNRQADRIEQLEALAALEPDRTERYVALALARAETGRTNLAVLVLGRAAERRPDDLRVYTALATLWLRIAETQGDLAALDKALGATSTVLARGRPSAADLLLHGRALLLKGDAAGALPVLREAASRVPVEPEACEALATAAERTGALPEARDALERLAALARDERTQAATYARIATLALRQKAPADAVEALERALRATPRDAMLLPRLAEAQLAAGMPDLAGATASRASGLGIESPVLDRVSRSLEERGRHQARTTAAPQR
jgi:tetratricopeptide (TPR) repeat protein